MAGKTKSDAQKAHEARNAATQKSAALLREARKAHGLLRMEENIAAMKAIGAENKAARIDAHEQRNAEAAYEAALRKADRKAANDNRQVAKAA